MSQINDLPLAAIPAADASRGLRVAFVQAQWHSDIVHQARDAFLDEMERQGFARDRIDVIDVPGALRHSVPRQAARGRPFHYTPPSSAALLLVVDGGIRTPRVRRQHGRQHADVAAVGDQRADAVSRAHAASLPRARRTSASTSTATSPSRAQRRRTPASRRWRALRTGRCADDGLVPVTRQRRSPAAPLVPRVAMVHQPPPPASPAPRSARRPPWPTRRPSETRRG